MEVSLRVYSAADRPEVLALFGDTGPQRDRLEHRIFGTVVVERLVAVDSDLRIVGHVGVSYPGERLSNALTRGGLDLDGYYEITQLAVDQGARRHGTGRALLHAAEAASASRRRRCGLMVFASNRPARRLYESCDFTAIETSSHPKGDLVAMLSRHLSSAT